MKNPLTSVGIEPAIFRIVAQQLKHCATGVPGTLRYWSLNTVAPGITTSVYTTLHLLRPTFRGTNSFLTVNHEFIRLGCKKIRLQRREVFHYVITEFKCNILCQIRCKFRVM